MVLQLVLSKNIFDLQLKWKSDQTLVHSGIWKHQKKTWRVMILKIRCFHCCNRSATIISSIDVGWPLLSFLLCRRSNCWHRIGFSVYDSLNAEFEQSVTAIRRTDSLLNCSLEWTGFVWWDCYKSSPESPRGCTLQKLMQACPFFSFDNDLWEQNSVCKK